jgi:hypothetical protein
MLTEPDALIDEEDEPATTAKAKRLELHGAILMDVKNRSTWETKQVDFYKMRHTGLRRKQKPWNNAADLHYQLIDTNIEKLKPLFFQQIVGMDVVSTFVPMRSQTTAATTTAEQWFDYKVREKTNLQKAGLSWIDYMLMSGRGVMKVTWNPVKKQVEYTAVDPIYLIVPEYTKELQDADRIVHVMPMSLAAYKRAGFYKTDKQTLDRLTSTDDDKDIPGSNEQSSAKRLREGITHDSRQDHVIVWEVYAMGEDRQWTVETYSPNAPEIDLRPPMALPYDHNMAPFVDAPYEVKDAGWYAPRGVAEILAPAEAALCHTWNQKHDSMQLFNKPVFESERDMPNTMNLRLGPGQILPNGLKPVTMPQPPISFDTEMLNVRQMAEQRVSNPDYGMGQVMDGKNRRTATEISAIGAQSQQAGDLRARTFRLALGELYKMTWALLIQHDRESLLYRFQSDALQLDPELLHGEYHIEPKGGINEVNKHLMLQTTIQMKQIFQNSPWISQPVLDKRIIELNDPSMVKGLFTDPNQKDIDEQTDELKGIPALLLGATIPVRKGDNYSLRIGVLMQYLQGAMTIGPRPTPAGGKAIVQRIEALLQGDATVDNNGAKMLAKQVQTYLQGVGLIPPAPNGMAGQPQPMQAPQPQQQATPARIIEPVQSSPAAVVPGSG